MEELRTYLHDTKDDWNYITPTDFYKHHFHKKNYLLIDLRDKETYDKGHIQGAKNIFWLNILDKPLPKDKKIFLICYVGHTSSQILVLLKLLGYDVTAIKYGYGISPIRGVPVAGWLNYKFPVIATHRRRTHKRKM